MGDLYEDWIVEDIQTTRPAVARLAGACAVYWVDQGKHSEGEARRFDRRDREGGQVGLRARLHHGLHGKY